MKYPPLPQMDGFVLNPHHDGLNPLNVPFQRAISDFVGLWSDCPRPACRHALACRGRLATCYDERRPEIIASMTSLLYNGYITEDGELL